MAEPWGNHWNKTSIYKSLVSIVCSFLNSVSQHLAQSLACPTCSGNIVSEWTKSFLDSVTSLLHVLSFPRVENMALFSMCLQDLVIADVELLTYARQCVLCFTYIMSFSHPNYSVRKYHLYWTGEKIEVLKFTSKFVEDYSSQFTVKFLSFQSIYL